MRFDYCEHCKYLWGKECTYDPEVDVDEPRCVSKMIDLMVKALEEDGVTL